MSKEISLLELAKLTQAKEAELKVLKARVKVVRRELKEFQRKLNEGSMAVLLNADKTVNEDDFGYAGVGIKLAQAQLQAEQARLIDLFEEIENDQSQKE